MLDRVFRIAANRNGLRRLAVKTVCKFLHGPSLALFGLSQQLFGHGSQGFMVIARGFNFHVQSGPKRR